MQTSRFCWVALVATALMAAGCGGDDNKCEGVVCGANATCNEDSGACACSPGFEGNPATACTASASCKADTCNSHGTCSDASGAPVCNCALGWTGANCTLCDSGFVMVGGACVADPCATETCGGHGTCSSESGSAVCVCAQGWAGAQCDACAEGFTLVGGACIGDPCATETCSGHGTCSVDQGVAVCACETGYAGARCDACATDFVLVGEACVADACLAEDCNGHGTCAMDAANAAVCTCTDHFAGAGCDTCEAGFALVGGACVTDSCATEDCSGHGTCAVVDGSAVCTCTGNFAGPACDTCAEGFVLDAGACVADPCAAEDCSNHGTCAVVAGSAVCTCTGNFAGAACDVCAEDFVLVDGACVANPCLTETCSGHGTCSLDAGNAAVCSCTGHFEGATCNVCAAGYTEVGGVCLSDSCDPDPCNSHGTCEVVGGSAICTCTGNFTGSACDTCADGFVLVGGACVADPCLTETCSGHGTCALDAGNAAVCTCATGYAGATCAACDTDYDLVATECLHEQIVPCDSTTAPANSTVVPGTVTITFTTGTGWSAADACAWTCDSGFHADAGACVGDVTLGWCNVQSPTAYTRATGETETIFGQFYIEGSTEAAGPLAGVIGKVCHSTGQITAASDFATLSCVDASFNTNYSGNNDEYMGDLSFNTAGTYYYLYAFSGNGGTSWTLCEKDGGGSGVATITGGSGGTTSAQIAAVRATADGTGLALPIDDATVTYLKPQGGSSDPIGFFVQGEQAGPAVFVAVDPASLTPAVMVGDKVSFDVTDLTTAAGLKQITALVNFGRASTGNLVAPLVQDLSAATDLVTALDGYESEAIKLSGTLAGPSTYGGSGHQSYLIDTTGMTGDAGLKLRLPDALANDYNLVQGCLVELDYGVMWRYNTGAQPSAYDFADFSAIVCPAPTVVSAAASSATEVVVSFDRNVAPSSVVANGSQFLVDDGTNTLAITAATVSGKRVTLTTAAQTEGVAYDILVENTITDTLAEPLAADWVGSFDGYTAAAASSVVISQLFPGGGTSTGAFKYDYIELHNRGTTAVDLGTWSVQYASATGTTWAKLDLTGSIAAGGFYLVQTGAVGTGGIDLPLTPDATTTSLAMQGSNGKVALVMSQTALSGAPPASLADVADLIGYGTANYYEGTAAAASPSANTMALFRASNGCTDSNDNAADFAEAAASPRNTTSTAVACP